MKQKLYVMCAEIVEKRKEDSPGIDTTQILNQLLADDVWLETVCKKSQYFSFVFNFFVCSNSRRCKTFGRKPTASFFRISDDLDLLRMMAVTMSLNAMRTMMTIFNNAVIRL